MLFFVPLLQKGKPETRGIYAFSNCLNMQMNRVLLGMFEEKSKEITFYSAKDLSYTLEIIVDKKRMMYRESSELQEG